MQWPCRCILIIRGWDVQQWHSTLWGSELDHLNWPASSSPPTDRVLGSTIAQQQIQCDVHDACGLLSRAITSTNFTCLPSPKIAQWTCHEAKYGLLVGIILAITASWCTPRPETRAQGRSTGLWTVWITPWRLRLGLTTPAWRMWCMQCVWAIVWAITGTNFTCLSTKDRQWCHSRACCWFNRLGHCWCTMHVFNNLFTQYIQCLPIALQWWHVWDIQNIHPEPRLDSINLWHEASEPRCRWVESQVYWDGGKHIYQVHSDSKVITCGCTSILHHFDDCPDVIMQYLNGLLALCEEVVQLILILQCMMKENRVCIQPHFACLFVQAIKCFIKFLSLHTLRSYHCVVCCNMVRTATGNFLVTSSLNAHVEQCLLVGQIDEVTCDLPPQLLCLMGQREDLFHLLFGQPCHGNGCIILHIHGRPIVGDKLIHTCRGYNPCWQCKHLYFITPTICRGKRPPTQVKWLESNIWIGRCMTQIYRSRMKGWRWQKAYAFWCVRASVLTITWSASTVKLSFLRTGMPWRTTRFSRCAMLGHTSYGHALRHAHGSEPLPFWWVCNLVHVPYFFHAIFVMTFLLLACHLCSASPSCSSDLSKDVLLPAASETGCLWLFKRTGIILLLGWWIRLNLRTTRNYLGSGRGQIVFRPEMLAMTTWREIAWHLKKISRHLRSSSSSLLQWCTIPNLWWHLGKVCPCCWKVLLIDWFIYQW